MTEVVANVRLTHFKARLFHFVESHPGQSSNDLALRFYGGHTKGDAPRVIRTHIFQINEALMNTPLRIRGSKYTGYYVEKAKVHARAV